MEKPPRIADAPALRWRRRVDGVWVALWVARRDVVKDGYSPKTHRIWPPTEAANAPLDGDAQLYIRSECMRLQHDMLKWRKRGKPDGQSIFDGTIRGLASCYQSDSDSSFNDLRYASRRTYCSHMRAIEDVVGDRVIEKVTGRDLKRWFNEWCEDGAHVARAHARTAMLRIMLLFGSTILEDGHCQRLKSVISDMEFENARPRDSVLTADHVRAVMARAHELGYHSLALAQAFEFELMLRPKDVIGEWLPVNEPGISDVTNHSMKWLYGIDWREISDDLVLRHRLSKSLRGKRAITNRHAGKLKAFDLRLYPMVVEELARVPKDRRVGPVVIDEATALPYRSDVFRRRWRRIATDAGIPTSIQNRDGRAGGITEGIELSEGNIEAVRHAAGHSQLTTTLRYSRQGDRQTADIAKIRAKRQANDMTNT